MQKQIFWIGLVVIMAFIAWPDNPVNYGPGVVAPEPPIQTNLPTVQSFTKKGYQITPLANFTIKARVLGKEKYFVGKEADLSPIDLALGWGRMSDASVLDHISISQSGRWYRWRVEEFIIPRREIETSSANMHMIPANNDVELQLARVREGNVITLSGKLVSVTGANGWLWKSSLTREDTGARACEVIWVESMTIQ